MPIKEKGEVSLITKTTKAVETGSSVVRGDLVLSQVRSRDVGNYRVTAKGVKDLWKFKLDVISAERKPSAGNGHPSTWRDQSHLEFLELL